MGRIHSAAERDRCHRHSTPEFLVGRGRDGLWRAIEAGGHAGGVFSSQHAAMTYAEGETRRRHGSIRLTLDLLENGR
ncbi:hypothetical protein OPKNFCMD_6377 [Methylobacterium crusticola]|uniref:Uncharacterized protein n=1 Tax=Methylobacterium crusticola TaxID=1697972 RepID=A0ABQ4R8W8_9HYPH|nr:hypothetical protein OPKNFCMD_6377 [Methylobacterium crusticola]